MTRSIGAVVVGVLLGVGYAAPAHAADEVLVSNTGTGFAPTLTEPLFDPSLRWVPGDARSATFYVRNDGADPAGLSLTLVAQDGDELLDSGALHVRVASRDVHWSPDPRSSSPTVTTEQPLAPGTSAPVRVRVAFAPAATNGTQRLSSELRLRVRLSQSVPLVAGPDDAEDGAGNPLPGTGAPAGLAWLLVLGSLLLGTGSDLVTRRPDHHGDTDAH